MGRVDQLLRDCRTILGAQVVAGVAAAVYLPVVAGVLGPANYAEFTPWNLLLGLWSAARAGWPPLVLVSGLVTLLTVVAARACSLSSATTSRPRSTTIRGPFSVS